MRSSRTAPPLVMPILSAGRHRNAKRGACFMEFASYLAGEKWSDHPACTHPVLAAVARNVNDLASDSTRATFVRHIHRVVGLVSSDPLVTVSLTVHAAAAALPIASRERQRALAVGILVALRSSSSRELESVAAAAFATAPGEERWARQYMSTSRSQEFSDRTAAMIVHTAVAGIALACVTDADARLHSLLVACIELVERMTGMPVARAAGSEQVDAALGRELAEVER
jgi:hypothetical protein